VNVKLVPHPAPEKFNTFNTFNTFANFDPALEHLTLIHPKRRQSDLSQNPGSTPTRASPCAQGRVPTKWVAVGVRVLRRSA
jgi:hypothetical protein